MLVNCSEDKPKTNYINLESEEDKALLKKPTCVEKFKNLPMEISHGFKEGIKKYKEFYGTRTFFPGVKNKDCATRVLLTAQAIPFLFYLFNLIAPAFLDIRWAFLMSLANFITIGSGYCFVDFEFHYNYFFNTILFGVNTYFLVDQGFALENAKPDAMTYDGGEFELTTMENVLQRSLIAIVPVFFEIARAREIIITPERKRQWDKFILDNHWYFLLMNLVLTLFVRPDFFPVSIAGAFAAMFGLSDKYALALLSMINILLVGFFGPYADTIGPRSIICGTIGLMLLGCRGCYTKDRQGGY